MTIELAGSSGGLFRSEGITTATISSGVTGILLDVPEQPGKVFRLFRLSCSSTSPQVGISLITDQGTLEDEQQLSDNNPVSTAVGEFAVSRGQDGALALGVYNIIDCKSFQITKNAGNTTQDIIYAYETGVVE